MKFTNRFWDPRDVAFTTSKLNPLIVCALRHFDDIEWKLKAARQPHIIWRIQSGRARQKSYIDLESVLQCATQFDYPIEIKAPISTTRLDAGELQTFIF